MSVKKVVRTYYSKKAGGFVTKVYEYKHKSSRGYVLVDKRGRVNKKNYAAYKASMENDPRFNRTDIIDLDNYIKIKAKNKEKLTTSGYEGHIADYKADRYFANAGYSIENFTLETGLDEEDVRDENNWNGNTLNIAGRTFVFDFTYTGNFWEEV